MPVVASVNLFHSTQCEANGPAGEYSALTWASRRETALAMLSDLAKDSDVVMVQEVRAFNQYEVVDTLRKAMGGTAFSCWCEYGKRVDPVNNTRDLLVIVARGEPSEFSQFTVTHESGSAMLCAQDRATGGLYCTTHFPLRSVDRAEFATLLGEYLSNLDFAPRFVFLGGDFNAFPDDFGHTQMQLLMARGGLMDATQFLRRRSDGKRAQVTFRPYPFDKPPVVDEPDKIDYILTRGIVAVEALCADDLPVCYTHTDGQRYGPTDHYPLIVRGSVPAKQ